MSVVIPFRQPPKQSQPQYVCMEIRLDEAGQATVLQNGFEITPSQLLQATEILRKFAVQWTESERKSSAPE